ncbi:MAG: hypothetical protein KDM64_17720, partial [Verrucomicrobiae bacterium]|nr:hypothetical protein [Verrucomicrobiae bacterium]
VVDAAAILVGLGRIGTSSLPPMMGAIAIHSMVAILACAVIALHPSARSRKGNGTMAMLAAVTTLLAPVIGCLFAAWMATPPRGFHRNHGPHPGVRFGNPFSEAIRHSPAERSPFTEPLATALRHGHRPLQRLVVPMLRRLGNPKASVLLDYLNQQPDARTHLFAQAALATNFDRREKEVERLRKHLDSSGIASPQSVRLLESLATSLVDQANLDPDRAPSLLAEASINYYQALQLTANDPACLFGKAKCLIRLGQTEGLPDLYGRPCAVAGAGHLADQLELESFSAHGNWKRTSESVMRLSQSARATIDPGTEARQFWLLSSRAVS